jgi:hypothetical protein
MRGIRSNLGASKASSPSSYALGSLLGGVDDDAAEQVVRRGILPCTLIDAVNLLGVQLRVGQVLYAQIEAGALELRHDGIHLDSLYFGVQIHG